MRSIASSGRNSCRLELCQSSCSRGKETGLRCSCVTACCRRSSCLARNAARSAAGVCSTNQFFFSRVILRVRVGRAHFGLTESSSSLVSSPSVGWFFIGGRIFYGITCSFRFWEVAGPRAQLQLRDIKEEGVQTMCIFFFGPSCENFRHLW